MNKSRLESFTDSIMAIAMTIMALRLIAPTGAEWVDLWDIRYRLLVYVFSFFTLAIYWKNHHNLFSQAKEISHKVLWLNIALVFWLTLFTFTTAWLGEFINDFAPELTYGLVMLFANLTFVALWREVTRVNDTKITIGRHRLLSTIAINLIILPLGFLFPPIILIGCGIILLMWVIPPGIILPKN